MDLVRITPRLTFLRFPVGHVYVWSDDDGLTLVDSGLPGSDSLIAAALTELGHDRRDVRRLVLTHFHGDHVGSAAAIRSWGDVETSAYTAEQPIIEGEAVGAPPVLLDWERPIFESVQSGLTDQPPVRHVRIERAVTDGEPLGFGDGAVAIAVPGHTGGSLAVHLPAHGVLFAGDAVARMPAGPIMLGVFNQDTGQAIESLTRMAELDVEHACFGHGEPGDGAGLRAAAEYLAG